MSRCFAIRISAVALAALAALALTVALARAASAQPEGTGLDAPPRGGQPGSRSTPGPARTEGPSGASQSDDPYAPIMLGSGPSGGGSTADIDAASDPYAPILLEPGPDTGPPTAPSATVGTEPDLEVAPLGRWSLFLRSYRFWRNPILVACVAALVLGAIGVYVILRRVVFATACLANVSGVGVALGALIGLDPHGLEHVAVTHHWYQDIVGLFGFSLLFTAVLAAAFAWWRESKRMSRESLLGFVYVVSGALLVLLASQLNQSTHAIDDIVFGSAVVVERSQVIIVPLFAALLLIVHIVFNKDFLFASFDPVAARAAHYPVRLLDTLLFVTIGLAIAIGTRAIGAMPVFSFVVLPPLTALLLTDRIRLVFFLAPVFGVVGAAAGYMAAFMLKLPVGPSMTFCCALLLGLASLRRLGRGRG